MKKEEVCINILFFGSDYLLQQIITKQVIKDMNLGYITENEWMVTEIRFVLFIKSEINVNNNTTQHNTTQHNTTQHNTTQHNTTQHNTTQHNTTQHNTTQHSAQKKTNINEVVDWLAKHAKK